jgi:hypothetical protein
LRVLAGGVELRLSDSEAMVPEAYGTGCSYTDKVFVAAIGARHGLAHEHRHQDEGDGAVALTGAAQHALFTKHAFVL